MAFIWFLFPYIGNHLYIWCMGPHQLSMGSLALPSPHGGLILCILVRFKVCLLLSYMCIHLFPSQLMAHLFIHLFSYFPLALSHAGTLYVFTNGHVGLRACCLVWFRCVKQYVPVCYTLTYLKLTVHVNFLDAWQC